MSLPFESNLPERSTRGVAGLSLGLDFCSEPLSERGGGFGAEVEGADVEEVDCLGGF